LTSPACRSPQRIGFAVRTGANNVMNSYEFRPHQELAERGAQTRSNPGDQIMKTLERIHANPPQIPMATVWLLSDLAEFRGKQELYTKQAPQKLARLRENAIIESAVASNRIEGVEIERERIRAVVLGKGALHDRNEQEVRGYQAALSWIHGHSDRLPLNSETIFHLHSLSHPEGYDSGKFKTQDGEIIEKHPDGRVTLRFKPLSAAETPSAIVRTCELHDQLIKEEKIPPLIIWAAMNLDFLCIHPFRDGNGRVSRLLLLLSLYQMGFAAGRYISLERLIEQNKVRYYETLQQSSQGWHEGRHDYWPYVNYLIFTLKELYGEFERRVGEMSAPRGEKTDAVYAAIADFSGDFHITELQKVCPGVSLDMIRKVLKDMVLEKSIQCLGRGKKALWRRNR
jgi:Fic family protein